MRYLAATLEGGPLVGTAAIDFGVDHHYDRVVDSDPDAAVIAQLLVHPSLQRAGIGSLLIRAAEDAIAERGRHVAQLVVDDANVDARRLYERLGYRAVRRQVSEWVERWPDGQVHRRASPQTVLARTVARTVA